MNIAFCIWLWTRRRFHQDSIDLMIHEACLPFRKFAWKQNLAAAAHRLMLTVVLNSADRVWMAIPAWESVLRPFLRGRAPSLRWLPVPSSIPVFQDDPSTIRRRYAHQGQTLVGCFGTHGILVANIVEQVLAHLLRVQDNIQIVLIGRGSREFCDDLERRGVVPRGRVHATGVLDSRELSLSIQACDLMLQPYPDGINTRRTTAMAALAHGKAMVTTFGVQTEPFWEASNAVAVARCGDYANLAELVRALAHDPVERRRLGKAARGLYEARFTVEHAASTVMENFPKNGNERLAQSCGS